MFSKAPSRVIAPLRLIAGSLLITLMCVFSYAQQPDEGVESVSLKEQIASQRHVIELAEKHQLSNDRLGYLWAGLAVMYRRTGDFTESERAYLRAVDLQRDVPSATRNYATTLDNFGTMYLVFGRLEEAERYNRMGAKVRERMGYRLDLARSEEHMAEIDLAKHRFKQAEGEAESSLRVMREEKDPETKDLIGALNALAFTRCLRGRCNDGLVAAKESVELARQRFGDQSMVMAHAQMALGFASWKSGRLEEAEPAMRLAVETMRSQSTSAGRDLLLALIEYRNYLREEQRICDADTVDRELLAAKEKIVGICADCISVRSLALR